MNKYERWWCWWYVISFAQHTVQPTATHVPKKQCVLCPKSIKWQFNDYWWIFYLAFVLQFEWQNTISLKVRWIFNVNSLLRCFIADKIIVTWLWQQSMIGSVRMTTNHQRSECNQITNIYRISAYNICVLRWIFFVSTTKLYCIIISQNEWRKKNK